MASRTSRIDWLLFFALGFFWGSSYLFIKIGVETVTPFTLIAGRLLVGSSSSSSPSACPGRRSRGTRGCTAISS
jgi:drug/metabolite transporter (DMT)-like permease